LGIFRLPVPGCTLRANAAWSRSLLKCSRSRASLVAKDKDEICAEGRQLFAKKRRRQAAAQGALTLGQKIRAAREARGWTQAELAGRAQVAQAYLSYLEQDQREPSLSIAAQIARELDLGLDELASTVTRS
jgi:DNA-binding XRE family transcriptional regulator